MSKNDGGPAFPIPEVVLPDGRPWASGQYGMTLRDYFAGQVVTGMLLESLKAAKVDWYEGFLAERAYSLADAMLAERERES